MSMEVLDKYSIKMNFLQNSFIGGMNLLLDPTRLAENEYVYVFNGRTRFDSVEPIKESVLVDLPASEPGNLQGIQTFGDFLLLFIDGKAFYKITASLNSSWTQVPSFSMSARAGKIWTAAVPASTIHNERKLSSGDSTSNPVNYTPTTNNALVVSGTPAALICQDGISRPYIIMLSGATVTSRVCYDYNDWTNTLTGIREYVPRGRNMVFFDGILYIVSLDSKRIYRSVTGRPLDFMVNIGINGEKMAIEALGGVETVAYGVSDESITAIAPLNTSAFGVACTSTSFAVTPDRTKTLFGEPTFRRDYLFSATVLNQDSFVDINGDFAFIDAEGLRSFNAVLQQKFEGRNSTLSLQIAKLFQGIKQIAGLCSATVFNNYAIFSVQTIYGYANIIFDTLSQKFISIDLLANSVITQFAVISTDQTRLFGITSTNKLIDFYSGDNYEQCQFKSREWCSNNPALELKAQKFRAIVSQTKVEGEINIIEFTDGRRSYSDYLKTLKIPDVGISYPIVFPVMFDSGRTLQNMFWNMANGGSGYKIGYQLLWSGGGSLTNVSIETTDLTPNNPQASQGLQRAG